MNGNASCSEIENRPVVTVEHRRIAPVQTALQHIKYAVAPLLVIAALIITVAQASAANPNSPSGYDRQTVDKEMAKLEDGAKFTRDLVEILNFKCKPPIPLPGRTVADDAMLDLDHVRSKLEDAEKALKGPADADKSDRYKRHEKALADAQKQLDQAGKAIEKYAKERAEAEKAGAPLPQLSNETIEAYEKALAEIKKEQEWIDNSKAMKDFRMNLPGLQKAFDDTFLIWAESVRAYWEAMAAYQDALDEALFKALRCKGQNEQGNGGQGNGGSGSIGGQNNGGQGSGGAGNGGKENDGPEFPMDSDQDGLDDEEESELGTDPFDPDSDHEGLSDGDEFNGYGTNPLNADTDSDYLDDGLELFTYLTDPFNADSDGDSVTDGDEAYYGTDPLDARIYPGGDYDGDGLSDAEETGLFGTDPFNADSDGDWLSDGTEYYEFGTSPLYADSDGDGFDDGTEIESGTNPLDPASFPGSSDNTGEEHHGDADLSSVDSDGDGLTDQAEIEAYGTDPWAWDSDGDEASDFDELAVFFTNPLDPASNPWS